MIYFTDFDLKIFIRLVCLIIIWKFLSLDYSSIAILSQGPDLFEIYPTILGNFSDWIGERLFYSSMSINSFQIATSIVFVVGVLLLNRYIIFLGALLVYFLELSAFQYRAQMYDIDFPLAILFIALCFPYSWKNIKTGSFKVNADPNNGANLLGLTLAVYIGFCYLLFGLSKFDFDLNWITNARLDRLRAAMTVWHGSLLPDYIDTVATFLESFFLKYRPIELIAATSTLILEVFWITSVFNRPCRWIIPISMFMIHIIIFLGSGILFLTLAVTAVSILIPWRIIFFKVHDFSNPSGQINFLDKKFIGSIFIAGLLAFIPAILKVHFYPFSNNFQFGWSYKNAIDEIEVYRIGYYDGGTKKYEFLPMNYGGFMDFRHIQLVGSEIKLYINEKSLPQKKLHRNKILQYVKAIRPVNSNQWLLGGFAFPSHIVSKVKIIPQEYLNQLFLIKATYNYAENRERVFWQMIEKL